MECIIRECRYRYGGAFLDTEASLIDSDLAAAAGLRRSKAARRLTAWTPSAADGSISEAVWDTMGSLAPERRRVLLERSRTASCSSTGTGATAGSAGSGGSAFGPGSMKCMCGRISSDEMSDDRADSSTCEVPGWRSSSRLPLELAAPPPGPPSSPPDEVEL